MAIRPGNIPRSTRPKEFEITRTGPETGSFRTSTGETQTFDNRLARQNLSKRTEAEDVRLGRVVAGERLIEEGRADIPRLRREIEIDDLKFKGDFARTGVRSGKLERGIKDKRKQIDELERFYTGYDASQKNIADLTAQVEAEESRFRSEKKSKAEIKRTLIEKEKDRRSKEKIAGAKKTTKLTPAQTARNKLLTESATRDFDTNLDIIERFRTQLPDDEGNFVTAEQASKARRANITISNRLESDLGGDDGRAERAILRTGDQQPAEPIPTGIGDGQAVPIGGRGEPVRTGTVNGRRVAQYEDGTTGFLDEDVSATPKVPFSETATSEGAVQKADQRLTVNDFMSDVFQRPDRDVIREDLRKELNLGTKSDQEVADIVIDAESVRNMWAKALQEGKAQANLYKDIYMAFLGQPASDVISDIGELRLPIER